MPRFFVLRLTMKYKNWDGLKIGSLAQIAAAASINPTKKKYMNLWDQAFFKMEPTFLSTRRFRYKSKNITPKKLGYEINLFRKYIYLRLLKRGGKKGANWVNVVQEMYNNKIALKFATDKILKNFKGWTRKIYSMQRDVININSRYE